jgi:hypothetical protein
MSANDAPYSFRPAKRVPAPCDVEELLLDKSKVTESATPILDLSFEAAVAASGKRVALSR